MATHDESNASRRGARVAQTRAEYLPTLGGIVELAMQFSHGWCVILTFHTKHSRTWLVEKGSDCNDANRRCVRGECVCGSVGIGLCVLNQGARDNQLQVSVCVSTAIY